MGSDTSDDDTRKTKTHAALFALIGICVAIEAVLQLGELGIFGVPRFRQTVYEFAGFWPGLLSNWRANFEFQPWTMFFTYAFLHAGLLHLSVNMITLFSLGRVVLERVSTPAAALLYASAVLGGAAGFAILSDSFRPMVGASGGLFGLAGAILAWEYVDRFVLREALWPVARAVLLLIALNVLLYYAMDRLLAWEAHLGGFIAGWIMALLIDPLPRSD